MSNFGPVSREQAVKRHLRMLHLTSKYLRGLEGSELAKKEAESIDWAAGYITNEEERRKDAPKKNETASA